MFRETLQPQTDFNCERREHPTESTERSLPPTQRKSQRSDHGVRALLGHKADRDQKPAQE